MVPDINLLHRLEAGRRELLEACLGFTDAAIRQRPSADDWSVLEVLAHLPDASRGWLDSVERMRSEANPTLARFDDDAWKATHAGVNAWPAERVFAELQAVHAETLACVERLTDGDLLRPGLGARGLVTVRELIGRYAGHDTNHANQVREIRKALGA
ncbi:MAG: DinB family protein [Dehalococcoidia bacterium]|nr:DinB family protein [Dehalococcoidia bacterium]